MVLIVVGGHKNNIQRGPKSATGAETIVKVCTAWEVHMYLSMALSVDEVMSELAAFAPPLVAVLPPRSNGVNDWISVESSDNKPILEKFLNQLQHARADTHGYGEFMDSALWGVCLIDVTATLRMPCVVDVKLGYLRHSPHTPVAKLERIRAKRILQSHALRLCGAQHYVYHGVNNKRQLELELCEKEMGYALETEEEYRRVFRAFFSSTTSMHAGETGIAHNGDDDYNDVLRQEARLRSCRQGLENLLGFFTSSVGSALLERIAFLSTSLLIVYDAVGNEESDCCLDKEDRVAVHLIDYSRSSDRRLNYSEEKVGFVRGMENMLRFLS